MDLEKLLLFFLFAVPMAFGLLVLIFYLVRSTSLSEDLIFPLFIVVIIFFSWVFQKEVVDFFEK